MGKCIALFLLLLPGMVLSQASKEDYAVYSQYLKNYQKEKGRKMHFVVRQSGDYLRKNDSTGIRDILTQLSGYLDNDPASISDVKLMYKAFADTLKKDTSWMRWIVSLNKITKHEFILENKFLKSLHAALIPDSAYTAYFGNFRELEKGWAKFHQLYTKSAVLVEFSQVAADHNRAVFYVIIRSGSLGGAGYIVFGFKENNHWKFIPTLPLWQS